MNDEELIATVRESFSDVRATTPADVVMRRGRALRARRRIAGLTGTAALAGAAAVAAVTMAPSGSAGVALTAWTVTTKPHDVVAVAIRQLRDPAGLQRALRADGVPAVVRFTDQNPPACLYYPYHPQDPRKLDQLLRRIFPPGTGFTSSTAGTAFAINRSAIPHGAGLWINVSPPQTQRGQARSGIAVSTFSGAWALVYASGVCPSP